MGTVQFPLTTNRPICPTCAKPIRVCLCSRFKSPLYDNPIAVTVLQHDQEKNHPLNSTRIVRLGLKNVKIGTCSDVHFEAKFLINLLTLGSGNGLNVEESSEKNELVDIGCNGVREFEAPQLPVFGSNAGNECDELDTRVEISRKNEKILDFEPTKGYCEKKKAVISARNGFVNDVDDEKRECCLENAGVVLIPVSIGSDDPVEDKESRGESGFAVLGSSLTTMQTVSDTKEAIVMKPIGKEEYDITATITKCGFTCSLMSVRTLGKSSEKLNFDQLLASQIGQDAISNGFVVKRLLKNQLDGEYEENEEYKIVVPPGTALLFPTKKSIKLEDVDFEVKNLIVLDGTWAKAKRMYHENPWLKLLPHLKLDVNKVSLYSEVRQQPKIGCLSTIESIVCTMKALGNDCQELENLLEVFESMVVDQRRCKDENLGKISST